MARILLAEDDDEVRAVVVDMIALAGHAVTAARNTAPRPQRSPPSAWLASRASVWPVGSEAQELKQGGGGDTVGVADAQGRVALAVAVATAVMSTATWPLCLALIQLSVSHGTPIRLLSFLECARKQNVLRTAGPVYQFRHARLQDRLAGQKKAAGLAQADLPCGDNPSPKAGLSANS